MALFEGEDFGGVVFKIEKGDAAAVGHDVAGEGLAEELAARVHLADGVQPGRPGSELPVFGFLFDTVFQRDAAQAAQKQGVALFGEQFGHADAGGGKLAQAACFGGDGFFAAEVGHGFEHAQAQGAGNHAQEGVTPSGGARAGFAHPNGKAV